jgi:UDP-glucose 6-dehydrogenase
MRGKDGFHTVVLRSTVMPGTTESVVIPKLEEASGKLVGKDFGVCYNPEFLREGSAVSDFLEPTITVLGAATSDHLRGIREIYAWVPGKVFETSLSTAETVKSMIESIMTSNHDHIERAVEEVLRTGKKKIGVLGLSFKTGTDDLRGSPLVMVIKRLLGEGCQVRIWDRDVALGRLVGSNRQFIEEVIPHIGTLLTPELADVLRDAEVVVIGTRAIDKETLRSHLQPEQHVVDLVNIEKARRVDGHAAYEGICW